MNEPVSDSWIPELYSTLEHHELRKRRFMEMARQQRPYLFCEHGDKDRSYWAMLSYKDCVQAGSDDALSTAHGIMLGRSAEMSKRFKSMPFTGSILAMDQPEHTELRSIISSAFTPKAIKELVSTIDDITKSVAENIIAKHPDGLADFRTEFSDKITGLLTCRMMGVPEEDVEWIGGLTAQMMQLHHPAHEDGNPVKWLRACRDMYQYAHKLAEERRDNPGDDLTSRLMTSTDFQNRPLTPDEYADFFSLLINAGFETTSNVISAAVYFLWREPEQREDLENNFDELIGTATEELARYHSPIIHFAKTAVRPTQIGDVEVKPGERVVLFYHSANFDEAVFDDPLRFNVRRPLKPMQLSFGTPNPHFCIGANLARAEIKAAIRCLFEYFPKFEPITEGFTFAPSRWAHGWRTMPVRFK